MREIFYNIVIFAILVLSVVIGMRQTAQGIYFFVKGESGGMLYNAVLIILILFVAGGIGYLADSSSNPPAWG
jgi:hypothetical protein